MKKLLLIDLSREQVKIFCNIVQMNNFQNTLDFCFNITHGKFIATHKNFENILE